MTTAPGSPPRHLGRDTLATILRKPHWEGLIPPAPHVFGGAGEATQVSPPLSVYCPAGFDVQFRGICVGKATKNAGATLARTPRGATYDPDDPDNAKGTATPPLPNVRLSGLWCYEGARNMHGSPPKDDGAVVAYSMDAVGTFGFLPEADWPDTEGNQRDYRDRPEPDPGLAGVARQHLSHRAYRITSAAQYLDYLAQGYPVVDGVPITASWFQSRDDGYVALQPLTARSVVGGHATVAVQFDKRRNRLSKRNSWSRYGRVTADPAFRSDDPALGGNAEGYDNIFWVDLDRYVATYLTDAMFATGETDAFVLAEIDWQKPDAPPPPRVQPVSASAIF